MSAIGHVRNKKRKTKKIWSKLDRERLTAASSYRKKLIWPGVAQSLISPIHFWLWFHLRSWQYSCQFRKKLMSAIGHVRNNQENLVKAGQRTHDQMIRVLKFQQSMIGMVAQGIAVRACQQWALSMDTC